MCVKPIYLAKKNLYVPCGKCFECQTQRANVWAFRCMLEASNYKDNCFVTLTYNEDNLPPGANLKLEDLQKFFKRLRKRLSGIKLKYFACGEYGSKKNRPHYHIVFFGWKPNDLVFHHYDKNNIPLYTSSFLQDVWSVEKKIVFDKPKLFFDEKGRRRYKKYDIVRSPIGFEICGDLSFTSCKYCVKYLQKNHKSIGKNVAPFTVMSRAYALGSKNLNYSWLDSDKIYVDGKFIKMPRIFLDKLSLNFPDKVEDLKNKRLINSNLYNSRLHDVYNPEFISANLDFFKRVSLHNKYFEDNLPTKSYEELLEFVQLSQKDMEKSFIDYDILSSDVNKIQEIEKNFVFSIDDGLILDYNTIRKSD